MLNAYSEEFSKVTEEPDEIGHPEVMSSLEDITAALFRAADEEEACEWFEKEGAMWKKAEHIGRIRQRQGSDIESLVREHLILKSEFWNYYRGKTMMSKAVDVYVEKRLNKCFDSLLQASASAYQRYLSRELVENPLRDSQTGLYNLTYFRGRIDEEVRRAARYGREITFIHLKLKKTKTIEEGEYINCIGIISQVLKESIRDYDVVARTGREEISILLPETNADGGEMLVERLNENLKKDFKEKATDSECIRFHWGLASYPSLIDDYSMIETAAHSAVDKAYFEGRPLVIYGQR